LRLPHSSRHRCRRRAAAVVVAVGAFCSLVVCAFISRRHAGVGDAAAASRRDVRVVHGLVLSASPLLQRRGPRCDDPRRPRARRRAGTHVGGAVAARGPSSPAAARVEAQTAGRLPAGVCLCVCVCVCVRVCEGEPERVCWCVSVSECLWSCVPVGCVRTGCHYLHVFRASLQL
jgi:hypothetical protein